MKISLIQFEPIIGGESTLCNGLYKILSTDNSVNVYHPVDKIYKLYVKSENAKYVNYDSIKHICENSDVALFINSLHTNEEELKKTNLLNIFSKIKKCKLIFYEHGLHTWDQCCYEQILKVLKNSNKIRILTNTKEAISIYIKRGYSAFLCRQPFIKDDYPDLERKETDNKLNIYFNSRFSVNKCVIEAIEYFYDFLNSEELDFCLTFRNSGLESKQLNYHKSLISESKNCKLLTYCSNKERYENQDYVLYFGYNDDKEKGKIEYSILEAIHYNIPILVHPFWIKNFKHDEYDITKEELDSIFIVINPFNIKKLLTDKIKLQMPNANKLMLEFSNKKIQERIDICINSF